MGNAHLLVIRVQPEDVHTVHLQLLQTDVHQGSAGVELTVDRQAVFAKEELGVLHALAVHAVHVHSGAAACMQSKAS
jgi:hypothetical protein